VVISHKRTESVPSEWEEGELFKNRKRRKNPGRRSGIFRSPIVAEWEKRPQALGENKMEKAGKNEFEKK